jgi:hypothetical protein
MSVGPRRGAGDLSALQGEELDRFCGGETQILVVHNDGRLSFVLKQQIDEYEAVIAALDSVWKGAFWQSFNLDISETQYAIAVRELNRVLGQLRCPMVQLEAASRIKSRARKRPRHAAASSRPEVQKSPKRGRKRQRP